MKFAKKKPKIKQTLAQRKADPRSTYWHNKAEKEWKLHIGLKFPYCIYCKKNHGQLDKHHLITRGQSRYLKFHPMNGATLCAHHHALSSRFSAHQTPGPFRVFLEEHYPELFEFMQNNKWRSGSLNYMNDYMRLKKLNEELTGN